MTELELGQLRRHLNDLRFHVTRIAGFSPGGYAEQEIGDALDEIAELVSTAEQRAVEADVRGWRERNGVTP